MTTEASVLRGNPIFRPGLPDFRTGDPCLDTESGMAAIPNRQTGHFRILTEIYGKLEVVSVLVRDYPRETHVIVGQGAVVRSRGGMRVTDVERKPSKRILGDGEGVGIKIGEVTIYVRRLNSVGV